MEAQQTQTTEIELRTNGLLTQAQTLVIDTSERRVSAGDLLKMIKACQKEVKADREVERIAAQQLMDAIRNGRNRHLNPLVQGEDLVKQKIIAYEDRLEAKRQEEEDRINAELQAKEEELRNKEATELREMGAEEEAGTVEQAPTITPPVFVPKTAPKIEGQHVTKRYKARVNNDADLLILIKAVAAAKAPMQLLSFNQVFGNQEATRLKEKFDYAGVECYTDTTLASKSY